MLSLLGKETFEFVPHVASRRMYPVIAVDLPYGRPYRDETISPRTIVYIIISISSGYIGDRYGKISEM